MPIERPKMVGWYDPLQLIRTARQVVISTIFGQHSDHRLMEALWPGTSDWYDLSEDDQKQPRREIWIDYVADTGDGWHSTYAVAYWLAQPTLRVTQPNDPATMAHDTRRADVLVFGGDEVYPTPSRKEYEQRLVQPFWTALPRTDPPHPKVFAIPGNHDWYDNLVSFTRLFCSKEWFAGWFAPQSRSYFAVKLPHGWWLCGVDVQLGSDIDKPQVDYFRNAAKEMQPDDRVILCTAEPHWVYAARYGDLDREVYNESNLKFLEERVLSKKIKVFVAGDLHHYRRHAGPDGTQKITAGGGGAFLHPTHDPRHDTQTLPGGFTLQASYPDRAQSSKLTWRNLVFPYLNPKFGFVTGLFYMLTAWAIMAPIADKGLSRWFEVIRLTVRQALGSPVAAFWVVALFLGFWLFTDTHSKRYRRLAGSVHGLVHLAAVFVIGWAAAYFCVTGLGLEFKSTRQLVLTGTLILAGGYIVGPLVMGLYLLVSLNVFGRHYNEAFSSLRIEGWKHFLRLKIDAEGNLTIFPIGIRRVPRKWKDRPANQPGPQLIPDDPGASDPELIEAPTIVRR